MGSKATVAADNFVEDDMSQTNYLVENYIEGVQPSPYMSLRDEPMRLKESVLLERSGEDVDRKIPSVKDLARRISAVPINALKAIRDFIVDLFRSVMSGFKRAGGLVKKLTPSVSISFSPPTALVVSLQIPRTVKDQNYFISIDLYADAAKQSLEIGVNGRIGKRFKFNITRFEIFNLSQAKKAQRYASDIVKDVTDYEESELETDLDGGDSDAFPRMSTVAEDKQDFDIPIDDEEDINPLDRLVGEPFVIAVLSDMPRKLGYARYNSDAPAGVIGTPLVPKGVSQVKKSVARSMKKYAVVCRVKKPFQQSAVVIKKSGEAKNYNKKHWDRDREILRTMAGDNDGPDSQFEEMVSRAIKESSSYFGRTYLLSKSVSEKWQQGASGRAWAGTLMRLGISSILDMGSGFLDAKNRYASVILNRKSIRVMKPFDIDEVRG